MKLLWSILKISGIASLLVAVLGYIAGKFDYVIVLKGAELPLIDGEVASGLIAAGLILTFAGHFLLKRAEKKSADHREEKTVIEFSNLDFVEQTLTRTRRRNYIMGIFFGAFGAFMIAVPFLDPEANPSGGGSIFLYAFGALILVLGVFMLFKGIQLNNIQESTVYKTIMTNPKEITALKIQVVQSAYTKHSRHINAHLMIGAKALAVLNVNETELELLRQYLVKHNPQLDFSQSVQKVV
ncbi:MAG: hypothetical protein RL007_1203 [Bacteroidota bacterium]|jgi:drug/metabolite transporter (DMT)-like permease